MTNKEKLATLEVMMELGSGTLEPGTSLNDVDEWDSMAALSFVILMKDEFNKVVTGSEIRALNTVQDILNMMS